MNIKCFYEPLVIDNKVTKFSEDSLELIKLWEKSWINFGWNPIILSLSDAKRHPRYNEIDLKDYSSNLYKYSVNGANYLELCYSRWFAYACEDGLWSDYDVINYGFTQDDSLHLMKHEPVFIDNIGSCGFATIKGYDHIIEGIISVYKEDSIVNDILSSQDKYSQQKDISDMHINRRMGSVIKFPNRPLCNENFANNDWRQSKLVHYHNGLWNHFDINKYHTRSNFIQTERPV